MRISDYEKGLKALGPFRVTERLHQQIAERARAENRSQTNYIVNLIVQDIKSHGGTVDDTTLIKSRRPRQVAS